MMASFVASGLATAPARVFALASAPRAHEARNAALATTHRRRVRAVPSSTARWTAAPARGDGADERARTRLRVLYEPSSAECGSDEELVAVAARDARELRRAKAAVALGRPNAKANAQNRADAADAADADALAREAKAKLRAVRQSEAARTRAFGEERPYPGRELDAAEPSSSFSETPVAPDPATKAKAADALAKIALAKATKTFSRSERALAPSRGAATGRTARGSRAAFESKPVDAAAAAAVFAAARGKEKKDGDLRAPAAATKQKKPSKNGANKAAPAHVPAPTGSGAHKTQWDSFVDWKMMEHQDYETIPDDQFERLSRKLHIKEKWRPMVSYLISLGLGTKELEKCLVNCEEIFKKPVAKVMTRVEYLQNELGFEGDELKKLIHKEPAILLQRNRHSIPRCRYLTEEIGVPAEKLPSMLRKQPQILHLSVAKGLAPRVAYFKNELLIPEPEIPKMLERNPAVLTFSVENQIKPRVDFLKGLGISHEGVVKMIVRHPHLLQYSFEGLEEHIGFLSSIGMNEEDVVHTVTRLSQLFSLSVKNSLEPKFKYLTDELGGDHNTCVKFPAYFSLSLDQRIKPRHEYLRGYDAAPDPFPMKYLSENDAAFAARAAPSGGSLEEFEEYKQVMVPKFKLETERAKQRELDTLHRSARRTRMREARLEQQRRLQVQNQGYSQRIVDARKSMERVKMLGMNKKAR